MNIVQLEELKLKLKKYASRVNSLFVDVYETYHDEYAEDEETLKPVFESYRTEFLKTIAKIRKINNLIKEYHRQNKTVNIDRNIARLYLKDFKHEFLAQLQYHNGSLEELINSTLAFLPENPGVNINNYVKYLFFEGYFNFLKPPVIIVNYEEYLKNHPDYDFDGKYLEDEKCQVTITDKAIRYLENEANISLKCKN